jgi:purine-binding chemotaxis protein CheW
MAIRKEQSAVAEIKQKYITFSLGDEEYGIPVLQVLEIIKMDNLIQIPHARDYFMGLMDIRGQVVPIINLKKKLGIHLDTLDTRMDRSIIIQSGGKRVGLAVDRVSHVIRFPPESIDTGPPTVKTASSRFIFGVGKARDQFVVLMNLENLFSSDEVEEVFFG